VITTRALAGVAEHHEPLDQAVSGCSAEPLADEVRGTFVLASSGTAGRPNGIRFPLPGHPASEGDLQLLPMGRAFDRPGREHGVPVPGTAISRRPLRTSSLVHCVGGTVVVMPRFDAAQALRAIEEHRVTAAHWVPAKFVRMLKLPLEVRSPVRVAGRRPPLGPDGTLRRPT
jgi:fatty-acyl-CoA synthase